MTRRFVGLLEAVFVIGLAVAWIGAVLLLLGLWLSLAGIDSDSLVIQSAIIITAVAVSMMIITLPAVVLQAV